ncbi:Hypothetical predicted protein [Cloeon dipterum]|uniref:Uncharacterized protein n=1 Tax=Cloeon dipterum TaxID=197152 RepID=A0A8S1C6Y1_9INSE|nr:Hypothetical predicted protein [Cloeon dipterum]
MQLLAKIVLLACLVALSLAYDPEDSKLAKVLLPEGEFEAFYPQRAFGTVGGDARAPHGHGSFYKHRNPALVDVKNAAAYGFRFDGKRRFNFD